MPSPLTWPGWVCRCGWCRATGRQTCPTVVDWRGADATDPEAATDAAKGASRHLPMPQRALHEMGRALPTAAARSAGRGRTKRRAPGEPGEPLRLWARPTAQPMTEDLPLAATTVKGRTRAAMTQELLAARDAGRVHIAIGRASDFFGAGVTESTLGERIFANALAGRRADFIGNPDLPHTYSYVPDIAAGLATLGTDDACHRRGVAPPGSRNRHDPPDPRSRGARGRTPGRHSLGVQAGCARPRTGQPHDAGPGRDGLRVRRALRARHHQVPDHVRCVPAHRSPSPSPRRSMATEASGRVTDGGVAGLQLKTRVNLGSPSQERLPHEDELIAPNDQITPSVPRSPRRTNRLRHRR